MNIKGLNPNILPIDSRLKTDKANNVKMHESHDRDADGRRERPEEEAKRHLSEDEWSQCLSKLESLSGIKNNGLSVRVETKNNIRLVFIEDPSGVVIRRMSEAELWRATRDLDIPKGKILDKAM